MARRRDFITKLLWGGASFAIGKRGSASAQSIAAEARPTVKTTDGRICGTVVDGVRVFKGIPYGAPPIGAARFMPCQRPASWSGVREALHFAPMAIQLPMRDLRYAEVFRGMYPDNLANANGSSFMSEDCLYLNVWSKELGEEARRPVMVWLHPGGFNGWAGNSRCCDGGHLAQRRDVVVVSLNHRLGAFGYLYLGDIGGPRYAESGNVGMLDIVCALNWVQANIGRFGGDPNNITIFGESGGAAKVSVLMAMPAARGLFHRAIVQSGSRSLGARRGDATRTATAVLQRLNIRPKEIDRLQQISPARILEAQGNDIFRPVVAGEALPRHPFDPDAPASSANVPMLIGTTRDEGIYFGFSTPVPMSDEDLPGALVRALWGYGITDRSEANAVVRQYRNIHPGASPRNCFVEIATNVVQDDATIQAERKAAQGAAPSYMYRFNWEAPGFGGTYGSCHTFELPFVFDNVSATPQLFGKAVDGRVVELSKDMSTTWASFAHTGKPQHPKLPQWAPYSPEERYVASLGYSNEMSLDPGRQERMAFEKLRVSRLSRVTTVRPLSGI